MKHRRIRAPPQQPPGLRPPVGPGSLCGPAPGNEQLPRIDGKPGSVGTQCPPGTEGLTQWVALGAHLSLITEDEPSPVTAAPTLLGRRLLLHGRCLMRIDDERAYAWCIDYVRSDPVRRGHRRVKNRDRFIFSRLPCWTHGICRAGSPDRFRIRRKPVPSPSEFPCWPHSMDPKSSFVT